MYLRDMTRNTSTSTSQSKEEKLQAIGKQLAERSVMLESTKWAKELFKSVDKLPPRKSKALK